MRFRLATLLIAFSAAGGLALSPAGQGPRGTPRNLILFIPDGLRALQVDAETAPTLAALRDRGVNFTSPHALVPTFTMPNASAMATGHYFGDTGVYSNAIFAGFPVPSAAGSVTPFLENNAVLGDMDAHFQGNFLNETTILAGARAAGYSTAIIGKLGPALTFDHTERSGAATIVLDDATGSAAGIAWSEEMKRALGAAGLPLTLPARTENAKSGTATEPGTLVANVPQQQYFADVATKVLLPMFQVRGRPFVLIYWSRDPDGSQHNHGDSLNKLTPGVNGPTSLAAVRNMDANLAQLQRALADLGLADSTNLVVSADHGVSTISKESATSASAKMSFDDVPSGFLPPGFLALDLAAALGLPVFDPDATDAKPDVTPSAKEIRLGPRQHPRRGNGLIGLDPKRPDVVVAANGGANLIYVPSRSRPLVGRVVNTLLQQDYVSGVFVDSAVGTYAGTLPLKSISLEGAAVTPRPTILVGFRSLSTGCPQPLLCAVEVADTTLQQGQGMHGSLSRADSMNFMAAAGPDFKTRFTSATPASNADIGRTLAHLLGLKLPDRGSLTGRVLTEALIGGRIPSFSSKVLRSNAGAGGLRTVLEYQQVGSQHYVDAAGFPGRTVGLGR